MQEVALILAGIDAAQQTRGRARGAVLDASVVTRRDPLGAEPPRVVEADAELDLAIAQHVGIRRAAGAILLQEVREHALAILAGEAHSVQRDAEPFADAARVLEVLGGGAVAVFVLVPVAHEQALHVVALLLQQPRRDGRIDAAGHANDDGSGRHGTRILSARDFCGGC